MEELQVTVDGVTRRVPDPFTVIATQNDVEPDRTYDLPLAELDRFMKKIHLGYPNEAEETELLGRVSGHHPIEVARRSHRRATCAARERILDVTVSEPVRATRPGWRGTRGRTHSWASARGAASRCSGQHRPGPCSTAAITLFPTTYRRKRRWSSHTDPH